MEWREQLADWTARRGEANDRASRMDDRAPIFADEDVEPDVAELAGQVKEALAPVAAPASVKERLRLELLQVAEQHARQDVVVEPTYARREWAIGAAIGSALALVGAMIYWLRNRLPSGGQSAENRQQAAASR